VVRRQVALLKAVENESPSPPGELIIGTVRPGRAASPVSPCSAQ